MTTPDKPLLTHTCRECGHLVSENAYSCPSCGAPWPANHKWNGYGWEYKSPITVLGIPLLHISFKYRKTPSGFVKPVVAKGVISVGQFGVGLVNVSQCGIGLFSLAQFTVARWAVAQFAIAHDAVCQMGLVHNGIGQKLIYFKDVLPAWAG